MLVKLLILALVGAFIGWMTNVFAIKLMFRPLAPFKIPLTPFTLQGLIPKRKAEIAKSIGETVETELLSIEDIIDKLIEDTDKGEIIEMIRAKIMILIDEKMPPMIPSMFKGMITSYVNDAITSEGEAMIVELSEKIIHHATQKVSVALIVEEKINEFDFENLEEIIMSIAKAELKHIEILGGFIGFAIGTVQGLLILFL
ncbi:MAG: DUF445 family protein [Acidaminobacteraceae bacterium]